jgi:hypothetical protein
MLGSPFPIFGQDFRPYLGCADLPGPFGNVLVIQCIALDNQHRRNVAQMLGHTAFQVILELVDDHIFGRIDHCLGVARFVRSSVSMMERTKLSNSGSLVIADAHPLEQVLAQFGLTDAWVLLVNRRHDRAAQKPVQLTDLLEPLRRGQPLGNG